MRVTKAIAFLEGIATRPWNHDAIEYSSKKRKIPVQNFLIIHVDYKDQNHAAT